MSRDEGRDSQLELLKVNDFVDGVVGVVWLMGNVWIVWPFKSGHIVLGGGFGDLAGIYLWFGFFQRWSCHFLVVTALSAIPYPIARI